MAAAPFRLGTADKTGINVNESPRISSARSAGTAIWHPLVAVSSTWTYVRRDNGNSRSLDLYRVCGGGAAGIEESLAKGRRPPPPKS